MMERLCKGCHIPILLCAGNHDSAARLSVCAPLLRDAGLYIAGSLSSGVEPIVIGNAAFFLLPYFNAEEARYLYPDREIRTVSDGMTVVCQELLKQCVPGKRNILISHCFAAGGKPEESDRAAVLGTAGRVALTAFEGFDYVALGHLHQAQQFTMGNTTIRKRERKSLYNIRYRYHGTGHYSNPVITSFAGFAWKAGISIRDGAF